MAERPKSTNIPLAVAFVFAPLVVYGILVSLWGFSGITDAIDQFDSSNIGFSVVVHALPIFWLLFSPIFVVSGSLTRPKKLIRDHFTSDLTMRYSPQDVSMATGAHNSRKFDVRDVDENIIASGVVAMAPLPNKMKLDTAENSYHVIVERVPENESSNLMEHIRYGSALSVFPSEVYTDSDKEMLMKYVRTSYPADPHLITFSGAPDLWLKPNPPASFPDHYDMVIDDKVVGQVIKPGRFLFCGVMVLTDHFPPNVRALLTGLCYQMMRS